VRLPCNESIEFIEVDQVIMDRIESLIAAEAIPARQSQLGRCVEDPAEFLADRWNSAPYLCRGIKNRFDDLFSLAELNRLLAMGCIPHEYIRLIRNGEIIPERLWAPPAPPTQTHVPIAQRIGNLVAEGYTLSITQMERFGQRLAEFCDGLRAELSLRVSAAAYFTPSSSQGFDYHYDGHDVIVLQLGGQKSWRVYDRVSEAPRSNANVTLAASALPILSTTLTQGDSLYVPHGFVHCAAAADQFSLHVSIGIYTSTVGDVLRYAVGKVADSPALTRELPVGVASRPEDLLELISAGAKALDEKFADSEWLEAVATTFARSWRNKTPDILRPE
jgi:bifunctional lysine-specific demethylase and histidyl-hydroxylase NO66